MRAALPATWMGGSGSGQRVDAGILDVVVPAVVAGHVAGPQLRGSRPRLPRASPPGPPHSGQCWATMCSLSRSPVPDAEEEPPGHQSRRRCGRLGDDRRVDPDRRARHPGPDLMRSVALAIAPRTPHTNGLWPWRVDPRVVVVRDQREREPALLRDDGVLDEGARLVLLAGQGISDVSHAQDSQPCPLATARAVRPPAVAPASHVGPGEGRAIELRCRCEGCPGNPRTARMSWDRSSARHPTNRRTRWTPSRC